MLASHFKDKLLNKYKKKNLDPDQAMETSSRRILKTQIVIHLCQINQVVAFQSHFCLRRKRHCLFIREKMKNLLLPAIFLIRYLMKRRVQLLFRLIDRSSLVDRIIRARHQTQQVLQQQPVVVELAKEASKLMQVQAEWSMTLKKHPNPL